MGNKLLLLRVLRFALLICQTPRGINVSLFISRQIPMTAFIPLRRKITSNVVGSDKTERVRVDKGFQIG